MPAMPLGLRDLLRNGPPTPPILRGSSLPVRIRPYLRGQPARLRRSYRIPVRRRPFQYPVRPPAGVEQFLVNVGVNKAVGAAVTAAAPLVSSAASAFGNALLAVAPVAIPLATLGIFGAALFGGGGMTWDEAEQIATHSTSDFEVPEIGRKGRLG